MDESKLKNLLKASLSEADFPPERRLAVLRAVREKERKDGTMIKGKISMVLILALALVLATCGLAAAAGLGIFGQAGHDAANESSAVRLEHLEHEANVVNETQTARAPQTPEETAGAQTLRETMLSALYGRRFQLTLNQVYGDGHKLYYTYTLTTDSPLAWFQGEGAPTGFDSWDMQGAGRYVAHYQQSDAHIQQRYAAFFADTPVGYIGRESMCVGDGASLNGIPLKILDSGETIVDDCTIQGFQEVALPEGYEPESTLSLELTILHGASLYYQDGESVRWAHVATPENRGILHLPFTVPMNGKATAFAGSVQTDAYTARATLFVSDVDISGTVLLDVPGQTAGAEAAPPVLSYTLLADGVAFENLGGDLRVTTEGQWCMDIRYDLPVTMNSLTLRPAGAGASSAEDIMLK